MSRLWEEIHASGNPSDQSQGAFSTKNIYLQCWGEEIRSLNTAQLNKDR